MGFQPGGAWNSPPHSRNDYTPQKPEGWSCSCFTNFTRGTASRRIRVPGGGNNFTKSQRHLEKSYQARGLLTALLCPTTWLT